MNAKAARARARRARTTAARRARPARSLLDGAGRARARARRDEPAAVREARPQADCRDPGRAGTWRRWNDLLWTFPGRSASRPATPTTPAGREVAAAKRGADDRLRGHPRQPDARAAQRRPRRSSSTGASTSTSAYPDRARGRDVRDGGGAVRRGRAPRRSSPQRARGARPARRRLAASSSGSSPRRWSTCRSARARSSARWSARAATRGRAAPLVAARDIAGAGLRGAGRAGTLAGRWTRRRHGLRSFPGSSRPRSARIVAGVLSAPSRMIVTVTLNAAIDRTLARPELPARASGTGRASASRARAARGSTSPAR